MPTAFIFPAFIPEYSDSDAEMIKIYRNVFDPLLKDASDYLGIDLTKFDTGNNNFRDDELTAQHMSYILSCGISGILNEKMIPDYLSGYSMGIYAALHCSNAITFRQGLDLITTAFRLIKESAEGIDYGMCSVTGLTKEDIVALNNEKRDILIASTNGRHSFLLSGTRAAIAEFAGKAKSEGALHTSVLNVSCAYHNPVLSLASENLKDYALKRIGLQDPTIKIVSGIDQRIIISKEEIITELIWNLNTQINWLKTMEKMLQLNVNRFVECGAGTSLYRTGRFMDGNFIIQPFNSMGKI